MREKGEKKQYYILNIPRSTVVVRAAIRVSLNILLHITCKLGGGEFSFTDRSLLAQKQLRHRGTELSLK